jgi:hypothetical protein
VDFLLGVLSLEREMYAISWLSIGFGIASIIILSVKVTVLGVAMCLWLGDNIEILSMVERAHLNT